MNPIEQAITAAGGPTELARRLGGTTLPQHIINWRKRGIPAERVLDIEAATGVSRHRLRPDIYPREKT